MKDVDRFDPDKGYRFRTYTVWWIRQGESQLILETLEKAMRETLSECEQTVLAGRFGLGVWATRALRELDGEAEVTYQRVQQSENVALEKLRTYTMREEFRASRTSINTSKRDIPCAKAAKQRSTRR